MRDKDIDFLMGVAALAAQMSSGVRLKVGAVIADTMGNIISTGYNGIIRGGSNELEERVYPQCDDRGRLIYVQDEYPFVDSDGLNYKLVTKPSVIHAEQNAIFCAARRGVSINGAIAFVTHSPCSHCAASLFQSGITQVYFSEKYRNYDQVVKEISMLNFNEWRK